MRAAPKAGFTLIEVLIAVAILAGMSLMMSGVMESIFVSKDVATTRSEVNHGVYLAMSKLTDDLSMAFTTDSTFLGGSTTAATLVTGFSGDESKMDFSTMSNQHLIRNHRDIDQVQTGYSLDKKEDGTTSLFRRQTDFLTSSLTAGGRKYELLKNVQEFKLSYYSAAKEEWVAAWDTDSISTSGKLPAQVKVKLTLATTPPEGDADAEPETNYFELTIPIRMYEKITF